MRKKSTIIRIIIVLILLIIDISIQLKYYLSCKKQIEINNKLGNEIVMIDKKWICNKGEWADGRFS